ncbi:cyclic peptide export ABC transporter [Methylocystis sp. JR02]|uniref:cyclic peptide export ABC transporter n=1 Tax=Methylocystis sp. JR02 TaxID=3046284 RepID=UPI0024BAAE4A|nr:cyclic peptide export ABC transporter [Methylocystis sp. JR02]MDJ0449925.1 cyclic peptide export ABC transporter [Methylocystis sp. JR02]
MFDEAAATSPASVLGLMRVFAASKLLFLSSVATGLIGGSASAWLLALVTQTIESPQKETVDLALSFFALCLLSLASSAVSQILLSQIAQENLFKIRLWLSHSVLAAPLRNIQILGPHKLMAALTTDVDNVVTAQEVLPTLFIEGSKVLAVFVYLWSVSPPFFLFVFGFVASSVFILYVPQKWAWSFLDRARLTENAIFGHFRAATEGGKELKMNAERRRAFLDDELRRSAHALKMQRMKAFVIFVSVDRSAEMLFFILLGVMLFIAPRYASVSQGALTSFVLAIIFLGGPLTAVGGALPTIGKGVVALRNIQRLGLSLSKETDVNSRTTPDFALARPAALELSKITHLYRGEESEVRHQLGPINLRIDPGALLFVTGGNGSGKTTLALILLGLFPPDDGEIKLGGRRVTDENRESYRQNFSAVFADAYVFDSLLGYSGIESQARAQEMLVALKLENKLQIKDGRFSTTELSRGQRKRLALLTAYVEDRPFYLFDEWAAEQDPQFRDVFYHQLLPELKARGKTVIVITHDDRYFHIADQVLRMDAGKIVSFAEQPRTTELQS